MFPDDRGYESLYAELFDGSGATGEVPNRLHDAAPAVGWMF
jgi:hypothetical protein